MAITYLFPDLTVLASHSICSNSKSIYLNLHDHTNLHLMQSQQQQWNWAQLTLSFLFLFFPFLYFMLLQIFAFLVKIFSVYISIHLLSLWPVLLYKQGRSKDQSVHNLSAEGGEGRRLTIWRTCRICPNVLWRATWINPCQWGHSCSSCGLFPSLPKNDWM